VVGPALEAKLFMAVAGLQASLVSDLRADSAALVASIIG
jgi:hypothetical protein